MHHPYPQNKGRYQLHSRTKTPDYRWKRITHTNHIKKQPWLPSFGFDLTLGISPTEWGLGSVKTPPVLNPNKPIWINGLMDKFSESVI